MEQPPKMNTHIFLEQFGHLAESPDGVQKLRKLILDLAVRGQLVPQNPDDEPAHNRWNIDAPGLSLPNLPTLPENWVFRRLKDISVRVSVGHVGKTSEYYTDGTNGIPFFRSQNVRSGKISLDGLAYITEEFHNKAKKSQLSAGDVLFVRVGANRGDACVLPEIFDEINCANIVFARPFQGIGNFLNIYLQTTTARELLLGMTTGSAQGVVNTKSVATLPIPIPPLAEQQRIVARVDELMALCDQLEAEQAERNQLYDMYVKSSFQHFSNVPLGGNWRVVFATVQFSLQKIGIDRISLAQEARAALLQIAVRGQLVPQNPDDEPASELIKKIHEETKLLQKQKKIRKRQSLPPVAEDECFFSIPDNWYWVRFDDFGDWGAGATPKRNNPEYYGGNIPWLKSGELNDSVVHSSEEFVTEKALQECSLKFCEVGDILLAMYGATVGKTAELGIRATTNQAVCACTPSSFVSNKYLHILLKAFKQRFIDMGSGGAQPNISRIKIVNTPAPLPPLAEQQRIVAKLDELMALCDQLEADIERSQALSAQLFDSLVYHLFEGLN